MSEDKRCVGLLNRRHYSVKQQMYALLSFSNTNLMNKTKRVLDKADNTQLYSIHVKHLYRIVS